MNRKQFISSQGATCKNWNWSWAFKNKIEKIIIFGAWDRYTEGNTTIIFEEDWEYNESGRKNPGYSEALDYIRCIENDGYILKTFPMIFSDERRNNGIGPAKIKNIITKLTERKLVKIGKKWLAMDNIPEIIPSEEILEPEKYIEGAKKQICINSYERNSKARSVCISYYGVKCDVCGFDFEDKYGTIGKGIIHIHHIVPLSEIKNEYILDPIKDLRPICPNCHAVIHRTNPAINIDDLKNSLRKT